MAGAARRAGRAHAHAPPFFRPPRPPALILACLLIPALADFFYYYALCFKANKRLQLPA